MREITNKYLFTRKPGKYNRAHSRVDNTINFATPSVPNTNVYVPDYSKNMKQEQAKLMDKLCRLSVGTILHQFLLRLQEQCFKNKI